MTYPKPAEVALYGRDGTEIVSSDVYDHVDVNDHYVRLTPTVNDPEDIDDDTPRTPEKLYVPWDRVHMIRRDYTEDQSDE